MILIIINSVTGIIMALSYIIFLWYKGNNITIGRLGFSIIFGASLGILSLIPFFIDQENTIIFKGRKIGGAK